MTSRCGRGAPVGAASVADDSPRTSVRTLRRQTKTPLLFHSHRWRKMKWTPSLSSTRTIDHAAYLKLNKQKFTIGSARPHRFPQAVKVSSQNSALIYSQRCKCVSLQGDVWDEEEVVPGSKLAGIIASESGFGLDVVLACKKKDNSAKCIQLIVLLSVW